jgi:hypothetical protein
MGVMGNEWFGWLQGSAPWEELRDRRASGWLDANVPELARLYGVPQALAHHPECDTGRHTELVLEEACRVSPRHSRGLIHCRVIDIRN